MTRTRCFIIVISALLIVGGAIVVVNAVQGQQTRLRVSVTGLPTGSQARVDVTGPDDTAYSIQATDERDVPPGSYTLTVHPVRHGQAAHYPVEDRQVVRVAAGSTAATTVAYRVTIPDSTKVLTPATDILQASGARIFLRADSERARRLGVGDHLISGEGPGVPHMLVRRVSAIARDGDRLVVDTVPARLDEALPAGVIRIEKANVGFIAPAAFSEGSQKDDPIAKLEFAVNARSRFCASDDESRPTTLSSKISYQLDDIDINLSGELDWDVWSWHPWASVSAGAELIVDHSVKADIEAAIKCEIEAEREFKVACASLAGRIARVGPITFGCEFKLVAKATVEASATWHTDDIRARTTVGFAATYHTRDGFDLDPTLTTDLISDRPEPPEHESSFGASAGLQLGLKGEDAAGVAKVEVGLRVSAGPKVTSMSDEFRGELEITPKLVAEVNLGKGPINVGEDVEVNLRRLVTTLWRIRRPSRAASSPPSPSPVSSLTLSPTPPDRLTSGPQPTPGPSTSFLPGAWAGQYVTESRPGGTYVYFSKRLTRDMIVLARYCDAQHGGPSQSPRRGADLALRGECMQRIMQGNRAVPAQMKEMLGKVDPTVLYSMAVRTGDQWYSDGAERADACFRFNWNHPPNEFVWLDYVGYPGSAARARCIPG